MYIHSCDITDNNQKAEATQVTTDKRMDKQNTLGTMQYQLSCKNKPFFAFLLYLFYAGDWIFEHARVTLYAQLHVQPQRKVILKCATSRMSVTGTIPNSKQTRKMNTMAPFRCHTQAIHSNRKQNGWLLGTGKPGTRKSQGFFYIYYYHTTTTTLAQGWLLLIL